MGIENNTHPQEERTQTNTGIENDTRHLKKVPHLKHGYWKRYPAVESIGSVGNLMRLGRIASLNSLISLISLRANGQWLTAKSPKRKTKNSRLSSFVSRLIYSKAIRAVRLHALASQLSLQRVVVLGNLQGFGIEQIRLCLHIQLLHHLRNRW